MSSCLAIVVAYKLMFSTYAEHLVFNKPLFDLLLALSQGSDAELFKHENNFWLELPSLNPGSLYLYVDEKQKFKLF